MSGPPLEKIQEVFYMNCNSCNSGIMAFGNSWWWILVLIVLLVLFGGNSCGCGCGCDNNCSNNSCGCGC